MYIVKGREEKRMKILIVDDDKESVEVLKTFFYTILKQPEIIETDYGRKALDEFQHNQPNIVFLDIRLPDINGIDVLKEMKKINEPIPVVMITAYREAESVVEAFRNGAYDCLLKPFDFDHIREKIMKRLNFV